MACYDGFGRLDDGRPIWTADFNGDGRDELLFYSPGDDNWWLGTFAGSTVNWSLAGNTAGFGHAINDGRPFWVGDFLQNGKASILFYYPGDDNWWVGTLNAGQLQWSFAGNTAGFGHGINDGRPFWIGDFNGDGRDDVLFYYPGDDNWWLGTFIGTSLSWSFAGNTAGFGHGIYDGRPFWTGNFVDPGRASVLFYYPGDDNWWVGTLGGGQLQWAFAGNTAGFGHGINDGRPFWIGDFDGNGRDDVLFYYPGDANWWRGSFAGTSLQWSFAGNTAGFGHGINDGRPFWIGDFVLSGRDSVLFYYPGDDNWWVGTLQGSQLQWSFAGNTAGFGHGINDGRPFWIGAFDGNTRDDVLFYYPGDGNWWLGSHPGPGGTLSWSLAGNTGRPFAACLGMNLILVGFESFTAAHRATLDAALAITRGIYAQVDLGINRVEWWGIPDADAGAMAVIDSQAEAEDLTDAWTVQNELVDVFIVRAMNGADGWSAVAGPCDKDGKGMTGPVVSLNGSNANVGNTLAHEVGHYLGLNHIPDTGNFIGGDGASDSWTGIQGWQGDVMKSHCFVNQ